MGKYLVHPSRNYREKEKGKKPVYLLFLVGIMALELITAIGLLQLSQITGGDWDGVGPS